ARAAQAVRSRAARRTARRGVGRRHGRDRRPCGVRWEWLSTAPGALDTVPAGDAGWRPVDLPARGSDDEDHWFRTHVDVDEAERALHLGGLATVCDVFVDGAHALRSESMFASHELDVAPGAHELAICARALAPILAE